MMKRRKVYVDGELREIKQGSTVYNACEKRGKYIPRFCYHEELLLAGNCRICRVEREGYGKPIPACTLPRQDGIKIITKTPIAMKAREGVMEFLLINHPLDCPICDQGGECDLQDQAMEYGSPYSRIYDKKRSVSDKELGSVIKTIINRCIHCTRCLRYMDKVSSTKNIGILGRGGRSEIGIYYKDQSRDMYMGNLEEICPVGALTSKPNAFKKRDWESTEVLTYDGFDMTGYPIRIKKKGRKTLGIKPVHKHHWLSDKSRYSRDSLEYMRYKNIISHGESVTMEVGLGLRRDRRLEQKRKFRVGSHVDMKLKRRRKELSLIGRVDYYTREKTESRYMESHTWYVKNTEKNTVRLGCDLENHTPFRYTILNPIYSHSSYDKNTSTIGSTISSLIILRSSSHELSSTRCNTSYIFILGKKLRINHPSIDLLSIFKQLQLLTGIDLALISNYTLPSTTDLVRPQPTDRWVLVGVSDLEILESGFDSLPNTRYSSVSCIFNETYQIILGKNLDIIFPRRTHRETDSIILDIFGTSLDLPQSLDILSDPYSISEEPRSFGSLGISEVLSTWGDIDYPIAYNYPIEGHPLCRTSKVMAKLSVDLISKPNFI